jgi:tetrahydromethanopterin S-methyltransferase subunit F
MAEEEQKSGGPIRMAAINEMMADVRYKAQIMARTNKLESGIMDSGIIGFAIGLIISMVLVVLPVFLLGMM